MEEITRLKSEAYDLLVKIQHLQMLLEEKNKQITKAIENQLAAGNNAAPNKKTSKKRT